QRVKEPGGAEPRQQGMKPVAAERPHPKMQIDFRGTEQAHGVNVVPGLLPSSVRENRAPQAEQKLRPSILPNLFHSSNRTVRYVTVRTAKTCRAIRQSGEYEDRTDRSTKIREKDRRTRRPIMSFSFSPPSRKFRGPCSLTTPSCRRATRSRRRKFR